MNKSILGCRDRYNCITRIPQPFYIKSIQKVDLISVGFSFTRKLSRGASKKNVLDVSLSGLMAEWVKIACSPY